MLAGLDLDMDVHLMHVRHVLDVRSICVERFSSNFYFILPLKCLLFSNKLKHWM